MPGVGRDGLRLRNSLAQSAAMTRFPASPPRVGLPPSFEAQAFEERLKIGEKLPSLHREDRRGEGEGAKGKGKGKG